MDAQFGALLAQWSGFYQTAATGAATFSGLLFVAISINVEVIAQDEKLPVRAVARLTFGLFVAVFFVGLLLAHNQSREAAAWTVGGVGALTLLMPLFEAVLLARSRRRPPWTPQLLVWLLIPGLLDLALIRTAFALGGDSGALDTLAVVLALMLAGAVLASWRLLVDMAREKQRHPAPADNPNRGLERQLRALVREQRAQNRRQQEQARAAAPPPRPPAEPPRAAPRAPQDRDRPPRGS